MKKVIVLSRVSTEGPDLTQQTDEVLREVYKDGYTDSNIIIIEDKESGFILCQVPPHDHYNHYRHNGYMAFLQYGA